MIYVPTVLVVVLQWIFMCAVPGWCSLETNVGAVKEKHLTNGPVQSGAGGGPGGRVSFPGPPTHLPEDAYPPVTSRPSDHSSGRLDVPDKGTISHEQNNMKKTASEPTYSELQPPQPCFRTCQCQILERDPSISSETRRQWSWLRHEAASQTDLYSDADRLDEPSSQQSAAPDDNDHDRESLIPDKFEDDELDDTELAAGVTYSNGEQLWTSSEALHVNCNTTQSNVEEGQHHQGNVDNWFQEMSDRLYNVSEVILSQATAFEIPSGLCQLESEVKQLTWTNSSFRRFRHNTHGKNAHKSRIGSSFNLTACLPLLTSLKLTHNLGLSILSNLPLLSQLPLHLEDLNLSRNNISVVPPASFPVIAPHLLKLDLSHNKLQSLDVHNLANLTALKLLDLSRNGLKYLHSSSKLEHFWARIEWLDLSHNALEEMPSFLKISPLHMTRREDLVSPWKMVYLDLSHNKIEHLEPGGVFAPHAVNLEHLDLSFNLLHSIPPGVFTQTLSNLLHLSLSNNHITHLSSRAFEGLTRLRALNISHNLLTGLQGSEFTGGLTPNTPDAGGNIIFNYTSSWLDLQVLDFSYNNLSYVSRETFQVNSLLCYDSFCSFHQEPLKQQNQCQPWKCHQLQIHKIRKGCLEHVWFLAMLLHRGKRGKKLSHLKAKNKISETIVILQGSVGVTLDARLLSISWEHIRVRATLLHFLRKRSHVAQRRIWLH